MTLAVPFPLVAAGSGAIVLSIFVYLFVSVKIDLWRFRKKALLDNEAFQRRCDVLEQRLAEMQAVVEDAEQRAAVLVPPPTSRSGMNLNKRLQAARMSKRGERPEQIAAALGLPRNEVALLLKVQRMTMPG